jgi:predicted DNA-binding transcriptional regulator YafY
MTSGETMRAERLISMIMLLRTKKRSTAQELARELRVSERTVYRDLESLSLLGVPVFTQSGVGGGVGLDEGYRVSLSGFTRQELRALFIASDAAPLGDLGLEQAQPLRKLLANLPPHQRDEVERLNQRIYVDAANWFQHTEANDYLAALQEAVWHDQVVEITYQPVEGSAVTRQLAAYGLVAKANIWYLVGRRTLPADSPWRIYRVGRIQALRVLARTFQRDAAFHLADFWRASAAAFEEAAHHAMPPAHVRLRLHPSAFWMFPAYLEGAYELLAEGPDGWLELAVTFPDTSEALARILALGGAAQVLDPPALRAAVVESAAAALRVYQSLDS